MPRSAGAEGAMGHQGGIKVRLKAKRQDQPPGPGQPRLSRVVSCQSLGSISKATRTDRVGSSDQLLSCHDPYSVHASLVGAI
jgi:hypothetical protein